MTRKWRIGDRCLRPALGPREELMYGQRWHPGVVEALRRGGHVLVRSYGWVYDHPVYELRRPSP